VPRHVLIVEDNPDGRESLRLLLTLLGYDVEVAADGLEGVQKALEQHPEVAIVDIGLPKLDGYQVGRRMRDALGRNLVLVAYTAYDREDAGRRMAEAGFDAHLVKPVEVQDLMPFLEKRE
jgi:CheY-like chemotaxis protein